MNKIVYIALGIILIALLVTGLHTYLGHSQSNKEKTTTITVCNAGSLTIPLQELAKNFENKYGIRVLIEPSGSVEAVRKVTDFGINCDVVAVSDYRLIPRFMVPKYAKWYIAFASNSIVVAYTSHSKYADVISRLKNPLAIFSILSKTTSIRYGFSNPNMDPCGYRAVGVIGLASLLLHNISILKDLVIDKIPGSSYKIINGTLHIYIPANIEPQGNLVMRPKEVDLVSLLESGAVDYAFEYQSIAIQHGLRYIKLPPAINLADPDMASEYSKVIVHILVGTNDEKAIRMAPIIYGVTVPLNAKHRVAALLFVKYLLEYGREVFSKNGQPFLLNPIGYGKVPEELRGLVKPAKESTKS